MRSDDGTGMPLRPANRRQAAVDGSHPSGRRYRRRVYSFRLMLLVPHTPHTTASRTVDQRDAFHQVGGRELLPQIAC